MSALRQLAVYRGIYKNARSGFHLPLGQGEGRQRSVHVMSLEAAELLASMKRDEETDIVRRNTRLIAQVRAIRDEKGAEARVRAACNSAAYIFDKKLNWLHTSAPNFGPVEAALSGEWKLMQPVDDAMRRRLLARPIATTPDADTRNAFLEFADQVLPATPTAPPAPAPPTTVARLCSGCGKASKKRCGRCRAVFYCGGVCQASAWPAHAPVCVSLSCVPDSLPLGIASPTAVAAAASGRRTILP